MLMAQYLDDFGLNRTKAMLIDEAKLPVDRYHVCDNVDLDAIYLDYCSYYQLKFGKGPKFCRRLENDDAAPLGRKKNCAGQKKKLRMVAAKREPDTKGVGGDGPMPDDGLTIISVFGAPPELEPIAELSNSAGDGSVTDRRSFRHSSTPFDYVNDFMEFPKEWRDLAHSISRYVLYFVITFVIK